VIPSLRDILFGCWHLKRTNVFSQPLPRRVLCAQCGHYEDSASRVVCLDCGTEFEYCLRLMRVGKKIFRGAQRPDMVTLERQLRKELPKLAVSGRENQPQHAVEMRTAKVRNLR